MLGELEVLGVGRNAVTFALDGGRVLKITRDELDASINETVRIARLRGVELPGVVDVHSVARVVMPSRSRTEYFAIIASRAYALPIEVRSRGALGSLPPPFAPQDPTLSRFLWDAAETIAALRRLAEVGAAQSIAWDLGAHNWGVDGGGRAVLFDLGLRPWSGGPGPGLATVACGDLGALLTADAIPPASTRSAPRATRRAC